MPRALPKTSRRRASTMIVAVITLTTMMAIISLGIDYGRVQLVKSQLQDAADAAARYAAAGLGDNTAVAKAIAAAAENKADGSPVVLTNADIETGHWNNSNRTFTPGGTPANAVRITARRTTARGNAVPLTFAKVIGRQTCDVEASSVALVVNGGGTPTGFVGLDKFEFGNNLDANSYSSSLGLPGGSNLFNSVGLASNGDLKFGNNTDIYGGVTKGPSGNVQHGVHFNLTGGQTTLGSNITHDPTEVPTVASSGALNRANNQTVTLAAGTYHYSSITFGNAGKIVGTGPVTIYVSGDFVVGNSFQVQAYNNIPSNMKIRLYGSGKKIDTGNNFEVTGEIYGPGFEINTGNNLVLHGSAIARHIKGGNNAEFYADTNSTDAGGGGGSITIAVVD